LKRKIFSILFALILAVGFSLVPALPAGAQEPERFHVAPLNPDFLEYFEQPATYMAPPGEHPCGYIPPLFDLSNLSKTQAQGGLLMAPLGQPPAAFDWRDTGKVTSIKDQGICGTCWAFGTTSVLESKVLLGESTEYDFSEQSVVLCVDPSWVYFYDDSTDPCNAGGSSFLASEVFIKKGAVLESCNPYCTTCLQCDGSCTCDSCPAVKSVTGYRYVTSDGSQIDWIKAAVFNNGPVTMSFYYDQSAEYDTGDPWGKIYDYYPSGPNPNHLVSIIGWNDAVPHPNPAHAGTTGAWLVKNSWGPGWGNEGYFWLAYDSSSMTEIAYLQYKDYDADETLYYYDEAGLVDFVGDMEHDYGWMASVFTSEQGGNLTHVDFWTGPASNVPYEIRVYGDSNPADGLSNLLHSESGTCAEFGYYSIPLDTPVPIALGQPFTVAVKITTPGWNYPFPAEFVVEGVCNPLIQENVSYASLDGVGWEEVGQYGFNFCLRARIDTTTWYVDGALGTDDETHGTGLGTDAFKTIQYAINDGRVTNGDTINVAAGTYTENVNINKRLTLNGAGSGSDPATNTVVTAAVAAVPVVSINANGASASDRLTLSNIRVTGGNGGSGTYENSGIKFVSGGSYTTFSNVASVGNQGSGLLARGGTRQDVQVLNCTFSDNGSCGFLASASDLSIEDLTITNTDMNHNLAGLYIDAGLNGLTLTGGHYNNNYANADPTNGLGIYITTRVSPPSGPKPMVLSGFTASNNVRGVIFTAGVCGPLSITDATLDNNTQEGVSFSPNANVAGPITLRNITVTNNPSALSGLWVVSFRGFTFSNLTIEGCTFNGSRGTTGTGNQPRGYGILLDACPASASYPASTLSNVSVTGCTMEDNNVGVYLRERDPTTFIQATLTGVSVVGSSIGSNDTGIVVSDHAAGGNSAHSNSIAGNTVIGIQNNDPGDVFDAINNWWGSPNGPVHAGNTFNMHTAGSQGNAVSDNVLYCPWLDAPCNADPAGASFAPVTTTNPVGSFASIQAGVTASDPDGTVNVKVETYTESVTLKGTTAPGISIIGEDKNTTFITGGICFEAGYDGLTVQNFTITGNGYLLTETYEATVSCHWSGHYPVTNLEFSNCIFDGEGYDDGNGGRCGVVIKRLGGVVKFENNEFKNYRGWATLDVNDGSGEGFLTVTSYTFNNNNVHDNWGSCALRGNPADRTDTVTVTSNTFDNNGNSAAGFWAALEINEADSVTVSNNTITNTQPGSWGEGEALQFWHVSPTSLNVTGNTITNNYQGIYFPGGDWASDLSGVHINFNNIYGNTQFGVWAEADNSGTADAENNWWNSESGPYDPQDEAGETTEVPLIEGNCDDVTGDVMMNTDGAGDLVFGNVDYCPWLVASVAKATETATGKGPATFTVDNGSITGLTAVDAAPLPDKPAGVTFPNGLFSFTITGIVPWGSTVTVTITLPSPVPAGTQYWKYQNLTWYQIPIIGITGNTITIELTDGKLGDDADLAANGTIVDPGGPGTPAAAGPSGPGGGGGGGAAIVVPTLTGLVSTPRLELDALGVIQARCQLRTADGGLTLDIAKGTRLIDTLGNPLESISAALEPSPQKPPSGATFVVAYNLEPKGAKFSPAITLTIKYDSLPQGVAEEDLYIAYWDGLKWVALKTTVDTEENEASGPTTHFTTFALIGAVTPPTAAAFSVSNLSIQPAEVQPQEAVNITLSVANTGGTEESYSVALKINGVMEAEKSVTVAPASSQSVSFSVTREEIGSYSVDVNGLTGSFTVAAAKAPAAPTPIAWWIWVIAAVVVAGLIIFLAVRRRAY